MTKPEKIKVYGYARVSTREQSLDVQIDKIKKYCNIRDFELLDIFTDKATGANTDRAGFQDLIKNIDSNHYKASAVIIPKLDRIGRSVKNLIEIVEFLKSKKIDLISIGDSIDTTRPEGRLFFHMNAAFAEFERERINERTQEGREFALANGVKFGRPEKEVDIDRVMRKVAAGVTKERIAQDENVGIVTLYKRIKEYKESLLSDDQKSELERLENEIKQIKKPSHEIPDRNLTEDDHLRLQAEEKEEYLRGE